MANAVNEIEHGTKKNGGGTSEFVSILMRLDDRSVAFLLQSAHSLVGTDLQQQASSQDPKLSSSSQETFDQTFLPNFRIQ